MKPGNGGNATRDGSGRFRGEGAFEAEGAVTATKFTALEKVDAELTQALASADGLLHAKPERMEAGPGKVPAVLCRASPGSGKSTLQRKLMAERQAAGLKTRTVFHVPTLVLSEKAAAEARALGLNAVSVRGRSAPDPTGQGRMCAKSDLAERVGRLGLPVATSLCETRDGDGTVRRCSDMHGCAYRAQFRRKSAHRFLTTSHLTLPGGPEPDVTSRVVDETFWRHCIVMTDKQVAAFTEPRQGVADADAEIHGNLLDVARQVVAALIEDRSPLELDVTAGQLRAFAAFERSGEGGEQVLWPDQSAKAQSAALKRAETRHGRDTQLAAIWTVLAEAKEKGVSICERLRVLAKGECLVIRVLGKRPLTHREPMLVLDADGDEEILSAVGLEVRGQYDLTLRPNAYIRQLHDRRMSTGRLCASPGLREDWRRIIVSEVETDRMDRNAGVLVGASRKAVRAFFEDAGFEFAGKSEAEVSAIVLDTKLHGAHWLWFGGRALGSNTYRDCASVIVIGREELPVQVLEDQGRALWGDTPDAPLNLLERDAFGQCHMPDAILPYEMTDGRAMAVKVPCHPDPRIRRLQMQSRECATRQLIERLRLARAPYKKRVLIGSNLPIPGLPVDVLLSWDELRVDRLGAALSDALAQKGGVRLTVAGLHEGAPKVFGSPEAAKTFLKRSGGLKALMRAAVHHADAPRVNVLCIKPDGRYARKEQALVVGATAEEARQRAVRLWACALVG